MDALLPHTFVGAVAIAICAVALQFGLVAFSFAQRNRRFKAERLFAENQERLALISSMSSLGFWSWEAASDLVWVSEQARNILGLDGSATLLRATLLAAIHPEDRAGVLQAVAAAASSSETLER